MTEYMKISQSVVACRNAADFMEYSTCSYSMIHSQISIDEIDCSNQRFQ